MQLQPAQWSEYGFSVCGNLFLKTPLRSFIGNSQAAASVDVANVVAPLAECTNEISYALKRGQKRTDISDLRTDVDTHSRHHQIRLLRREGIELPRFGNRDAELMLM